MHCGILRRSGRPGVALFAGVAFLLIGAGCGSDERSPSGVDGTTSSSEVAAVASSAATTTTTEPTTTTAEPTTTTIDPVEVVIETMTMQDKIGQMLMPVVRGTGVEAVTNADLAYNTALSGFGTPAEIVDGYRLGGIMYLGPNVESPEQIERFSTDLQRTAAEVGLLPMFIAVDQEGGRVQRIRGDGVTDVASARSLAGDADLVYSTALITGREMRDLGVNVVFAPVADVVRSDVGVIGNRSYGSDPAVVSEMVESSIAGLQEARVAAVAKHWPG
ncbi:MAG: glycoside hydrolase family 3 protein, partial [Acidimicrobiales bacterium]|nr:glycoside hydrolase family 3 protein [Acidimicrobiales bacterium]